VSKTIVWFRRDLRLDDNPAWARAVASGAEVIPLFIFAPEDEAPWDPGGAARWWLHHALENLEKQLHRFNSRLILREGRAEEVLPDVTEAAGAEAVYWNRLYEPQLIARDSRIKENLKGN